MRWHIRIPYIADVLNCPNPTNRQKRPTLPLRMRQSLQGFLEDLQFGRLRGSPFVLGLCRCSEPGCIGERLNCWRE